MKASEIIKPKPFLIHGSKKKFPVGFVLLPQLDGYVNLPETKEHEDIFEKYRPEGCLSRLQSVFMLASTNIDNIENAGGYDDYIYEVKHQGKIERNDLAWYSEISNIIEPDINDPELVSIVDNYWNGIRFPNKQNSLWEYRSPSATIVKLIKN